MSLFGNKKEVRDLKLPEAPMMFPELPSEEVHEAESMGSTMPTLPKLQPISFDNLNSSQMPPMAPMLKVNMPEARVPSMVRLPSAKMMSQELAASDLASMRLKEPLFVKIDKYKEAMANFELIKKRLQETSSLLDKIKDTRKKEEAELTAWTQELESIKVKINSIDKKIFSSLD